MSRIAWVLTVLVIVLLGVGWWFLAWSPTSEEIADVRAETERVESLARNERARAAQLREVRSQTPELEYELTRADVLIPTDAQVPSILRQLELAAEASGVRLNSIAPGVPSPTEVNGVTVSTIALSMSLEGTYYQVIDLMRRMEDPDQFVRGMTWTGVSLSPADFPTLNVSLSAQLYARDATTVAAPEPAPAGDDGAENGDVDDDAPVDEDLEELP